MTSTTVSSGITDPDYTQFVFEAERWNYHSSAQNQITWLQGRKKMEHVVSLQNVSVNTDGTITIGANTFKATNWAFEQFCGKLGIPRPFARKIPPDLLLDNIKRLIKEKIHSVDDQFMFHFVEVNGDQVIEGCTKEDYLFVEAIDFITAGVAMDGNGYSTHDLVVGDRMIEIDLLIDDVVITTPTTKSNFKVGVNLRSSDVGDVNPTARLFLFDEAKDATFVLSTEWGRVDRIRNKKMSVERTFTNFMGHVREMIIPVQRLEAILEECDQKEATDAELQNWFSTFNRSIQNKEVIDDLLQWTEEQRKEAFKRISVRRKENTLNKLQGYPVQPDQISDYNKRDLSAIVSQYAQNAVFEEREPLRRLGGSFVKLDK